MNLLELFLECSVCPLCNVNVKPTLSVLMHCGGRTDYTLTGYKYPLVFTKHLDYGLAPTSFFIQDKTDILENSLEARVTNVTLHSYCPCDNYYCEFFRIASMPMNILAIYPTARESIIIGKYQIINHIITSLRGSTVVRKYSQYHTDDYILLFKNLVSRSAWPFTDETAFEEKVNKLLLLK